MGMSSKFTENFWRRKGAGGGVRSRQTTEISIFRQNCLLSSLGMLIHFADVIKCSCLDTKSGSSKQRHEYFAEDENCCAKLAIIERQLELIGMFVALQREPSLNGCDAKNPKPLSRLSPFRMGGPRINTETPWSEINLYLMISFDTITEKALRKRSTCIYFHFPLATKMCEMHVCCQFFRYLSREGRRKQIIVL